MPICLLLSPTRLCKGQLLLTLFLIWCSALERCSTTVVSVDSKPGYIVNGTVLLSACISLLGHDNAWCCWACPLAECAFLLSPVTKMVDKLPCWCTGAALLGDEAGAPGRLAFLCYAQLEAEEADEALLGQATKNLVFLAPLLYAADLAAGRVPDVAQQGSAAGVPFDSATDTRAQRKSVASGKALQQGAQGDAQDGPRLDIGEAEDEGPDDGEQEGTPMLTMHGLIRRMARLAGDRQWGRAPARCAALRFAAALASRLGPDRVAPYLPALIAPLYRLTEGAAPAQPDEVGSWCLSACLWSL